MKMKFASKVIFFKETSKFKDAINLCYSRQNIILQSRIPTFYLCCGTKNVKKFNPCGHLMCLEPIQGILVIV
jgi:hypothetical protein